MAPNTPKQWHIFIVDLEPRIGTKPGKQRPCIVIQPDEFGESGLPSSVVLPITTNVSSDNNFPLRVKIPKGICNLEKDSEAMIDQILAWDNELFRKDLGILPEAIQDEIKKALLEFLDII